MIWKLIAWIVSRKSVADWLIRRAMRTPYTHITHNGSTYMERYWLFNSYERGPEKQERAKYTWFPWNIRIHWIRRADVADHLHDHPWNARTFILRGWYADDRIFTSESGAEYIDSIYRHVGDTALIGYGEYHHISQVAPQGAWTLFISGPYQGTWGFLVDGVKIYWRTYLGLNK